MEVFMTIVLWVLQVLLAVALLAHGWLFLSPPPEIAVQMNESLPRWFQRFLGVAEVLTAIGLTLPGLTGILPWLVSWAAAGIMLVMVSTTILHLARRVPLRGDHADAARHGDVRGVHAASRRADPRPRHPDRRLRARFYEAVYRAMSLAWARIGG
jgi:uncharacterized membrane protein YphA (DoxX/SURF4 family)